MKTSIAALLLGLVATSATAQADGPIWYADFDAAAAAAKEQKKDLFVDFTGSDWCGWCIRLHKEVFDHDEFLTAAQESFILVALDYPSGEEAKAKVPNPDRNKELSEKYEIAGFPTILLMTAEGDVFAQTGYREGGPEAYVEHMSAITTSGKKAMVEVKQIAAEFAAAEGEAKTAVWEKALKSLESLDSDSPFTAQLAETITWALTFDADNAKGLKARAVSALLEKGIVDDALFAAAMELDPKNEAGMHEKVVKARFQNVHDDDSALAALVALDALVPHGFKDKEIGFELTFTAASWANGPLKKPELAKQYATAALAIGSEQAEMVKALNAILAG